MSPNTPRPDPVTILTDTWSHLAAAVTDSKHPYYLASVATTSDDGRPSTRTIVLREADTSSRLLSFQTDRRSAKCREIQVDQRVTLLFWDPATKVQVRVDAVATIHTSDAVADAAWARVPQANRMNYSGKLPPGTAIPSSEYARDGTEAFARENFAVVRCAVREIDWLQLDPAGHRRLRFTYRADGVTHQWVVP